MVENMKRQSLDPKWPGFVCILPWLAGFFIFQLYPFLSSFIYSFSNFTVGKAWKFIGTKNYITMFTNDRNFWNSVKVTLIYVFFSVPFKLAFSLFIAIILNLKIRFLNVFRTIYYLPSILGASVGIAVLWRSLFNRQGLVNTLLSYLKFTPIDFLGNPDISIYTISLLSVWQFGSSMVIFLAALKQIPGEMVEAARVDGANRFHVFFKITLPMISPMIFFNLIMQMTLAFQQFNSPYLITQGGPLKSTYMYGLMLYENAFKFQRMGYACAQSWVLFLIILFFTALVFKSSPYWTYYEDGGK
jgi:oligogalacturonide transport system permease protein